MGAREDKEGGGKEELKAGSAAAMAPQSKGKKNAYSNSVQKMTCPYCPRVFPWASSLQRHMLTHTGAHTHTHTHTHTPGGWLISSSCSSGQKPFPCPKCDALFSTKSNCERHLLRKHGVTQRTLRRNGAIVKKDADDGSHESAGRCGRRRPWSSWKPLADGLLVSRCREPVGHGADGGRSGHVFRNRLRPPR